MLAVADHDIVADGGSHAVDGVGYHFLSGQFCQTPLFGWHLLVVYSHQAAHGHRLQRTPLHHRFALYSFGQVHNFIVADVDCPMRIQFAVDF